MTRTILDRLKLPNKTKDLVEKLVRNHMFFSDPDQISQWLANVRTFDSRPGGKLTFEDGRVATCTSFVLGKEVSFIADSFGNFTAKVSKGNEGNALQLKFAILTDDVEEKSAEILEILSRLQTLL